jgi:hypothetical protein
MNLQVRATASQSAINSAQEQIKAAWNDANDNAEILFYEGDYPVKDMPSTAYLTIGSQVRWGFNNGFDAWGFGKNDVDRSISGQKEYAYSRVA